jgi:hypothetical protein
MHPGPVVVVVKSGALTEIHSNGCITVHPAGSAFFETKAEVHNAINQTAGVAEVYATFLSPAALSPWYRNPIPVEFASTPTTSPAAGSNRKRRERAL